MKSTMNRRALIELLTRTGVGGGLAGLCSLPTIGEAKDAGPGKPPRFFLHIVVRGAMDQHYFLDARPRKFCSPDLMLMADHAPGYGEPTVWRDQYNSQRHTLAFPFADPLKPYFSNKLFSIVNGVGTLVARSDSGHETSLSYMAKGGVNVEETLYLPIAQQHRGLLDAVCLGPVNYFSTVQFFDPKTNIGQVLELLPSQLASFGENVHIDDSSFSRPELQKYLEQVTRRLTKGTDSYSEGVSNLHKGSLNSSDLYRLVQKIKKDVGPISNYPWVQANQLKMFTEVVNIRDSMRLLHQYFQQGVTNVGILHINLDTAIDTHDAERGREVPQMYAMITEYLRTIFDYLSTETLKSPDGRVLGNLSQYVTFVVSTEFGRTLLQLGGDPGKPTSATQLGSNHNQSAQTMLVGGAGIRGGMILGGTDLQQYDPVKKGFLDACAAHESIEQKDASLGLIRPMGVPFDFERGIIPSDQPRDFFTAGDEFINMSHIVNTVYQVFGVPLDKHRRPVAGRLPARFIKPLVA